MDILSTGDTTGILVSTVLFLLMSIPGLVFSYSGSIKRKNVLNTTLTFIAFSIASIIYRYSFAFLVHINSGVTLLALTIGLVKENILHYCPHNLCYSVICADYYGLDGGIQR